MAPLTPVFEFAYHGTVASLEPQLGESAAALEAIAESCDSGDAYEQWILTVRQKRRVISVPSRQLDAVQRRINELIFPVDLSMGPEVHGYVARRSIRTNASPHVGAKFLQKFDIKDFFNTITMQQIVDALTTVGFGEQAALMLGRLVCCNGQLPLGARTSPRISNLVLGDFDFAISELAAQRSITYTRFADDLSFSSEKPFDVGAEVEEELRTVGFTLNADKSKSFKHGQPMFVTGLAVSDAAFPRLRKRLKAQLRREFYFIEKFGLEDHAKKTGQNPGRAASRLMGQYHYARSIEPQFAAKLESLYPVTFRSLIPSRTEESVERVRRYRKEFLDEVVSAPSLTLPVYIPSTELGTA